MQAMGTKHNTDIAVNRTGTLSGFSGFPFVDLWRSILLSEYRARSGMLPLSTKDFLSG